MLFEFLFYAGIIGGIQAFLTPQINNFDGSFFEYFSYHFSHGGIIFLPIFMYLYLNYELTKFSWLRVVLYLNMVLAFVMPLNFQIDSNYMYLAYPPNVNNPLILGEWPYYILYWEFIIVIFTYTTYVISTRKSCKNYEITNRNFHKLGETGKDEGMEKNHKEPVKKMIELILSSNKQFSIIDAGCGNGWAVRLISN